MLVRWNKIQIVGLALAGVAALILAWQYATGSRITLQTTLGIEPTLGNVPIGGALAILAALVYLVGRVLDVIERHRSQFRRPPRP